jgi:hypothetical protein
MINLFGDMIFIDTTDGSEITLIMRTENGYTTLKVKKDKVVKVTEEGEVVVCE